MRGVGIGTLAALLACAANARADGIVAAPCSDEQWTCESAAIAFDHSEALPIEWQFDTGWIPQGQPIQVHLWGLVAANTRVSLAGFLRTSWPEVLALAVPGAPGMGELGYHYGVETGAEASITVGQLNWTGDIPYVPQIDFQVEATESFDPWAFDPGVTASASSMPLTVAQVDLLGLVGPSIPGFSGGFQLDVALDLDVSYRTDRIVMTTPDGTPVPGGAIVADDGTSLAGYAGGPYVELDVHPEGTVTYDGVVHLLPSLYIEVFGNPQTLQLADVPIDLPADEQSWVFDAQRVHVPLPDLELTAQGLDFGAVAVEEEAFMRLPLHDAGEADLTIDLSTTDPGFELDVDHVELDPGESKWITVWFRPTEPGEIEAELVLASNDPDVPVEKLWLRGGDGVGLDTPLPAEPEVEAEGGCGCSTTPAPRAPWLALLAPLFLRRRKR